MTLPRVARVTYSYNQSLEDAGKDGYFLDFYIVRADGVLIDRRETFSTRDKFLEALEQVVPTLSMPEGEEEDGAYMEEYSEVDWESTTV